MKLNKGQYIALGGVIIGLVVTYVVAVYAIPRMLVTLTKAAPATQMSINNSYVLGNKVLAKADGKDKNVVNVFILDKSSKGVSGKMVTLTGEGVSVNPEVVNTDKDGKATFNITSEKEAIVTLSASVDGVPLSKTLRVTFRN